MEWGADRPRCSAPMVNHQALPDVAWTVLCSAEYARRRGTPDEVLVLTGHAVIAYAGPTAPMAHLQHFMTVVRNGDAVGSSNKRAQHEGMIRAGLGVGLLPCFVDDMELEMVRCFPPPAGISTPRWIVTSAEAWALPRVRSLVGIDAEAMRRLISNL